VKRVAGKYFTTDFYNEILRHIREGKYWYAVEDKVRREYPYPEKILEFLNTDHIPLGFDPRERFIFHRTSLVDFLPLFPLFPDEETAGDMIEELVNFYAYLHKREFMRELKKRGKVAVLQGVLQGALDTARAEGWQQVLAVFTVEEGGFETSEINFVGSVDEIVESIENHPGFEYFIETYEDPRNYIDIMDVNTVYFEPYLSNIPDTKGHAFLRRLA
jgi:hypothetical protein